MQSVQAERKAGGYEQAAACRTASAAQTRDTASKGIRWHCKARCRCCCASLRGS